MNCYYDRYFMDKGPGGAVCNVPYIARQNNNFRTTVWTGCNVQMTVMCIAPHDDIGEEIHEDWDQIIRVEYGRGCALMGMCARHPDQKILVKEGDTVFVPAGTWHNVKNMGNTPLKLSSVYAPPAHPAGTVHVTKPEEY